MDILVVGGELDLARLHVGQNRFQALRDGSGVGFFNDAGIAQHLGVGQRALDILPVHPLVKGDGGVEVVDKGVGFLLKPPGPEFHGITSW